MINPASIALMRFTCTSLAGAAQVSFVIFFLGFCMWGWSQVKLCCFFPSQRPLYYQSQSPLETNWAFYVVPKSCLGNLKAQALMLGPFSPLLSRNQWNYKTTKINGLDGLYPKHQAQLTGLSLSLFVKVRSRLGSSFKSISLFICILLFFL